MDDNDSDISYEDEVSNKEDHDSEKSHTEDLGTDNQGTGIRRTTRNNAGKIGPRLLMEMGGKKYKTMNYNLLMKKKRMERVKKKVILTTLQKKSRYMTGSDDLMQRAVGIIMAQQMSAKKGIKKFGERAIAAIMKEFAQLDQGAFPGKPVVEPADANLLSPADKKRALEAVNIIAEKRCGKIKGRTCADGSKQKRFLGQNETIASPTGVPANCGIN